MKTIFTLLFALALLSCGEGNRNAEENENAATEESTDKGDGATISPQLEMDTSETRFEVDTISSSGEAEQRQEDGL